MSEGRTPDENGPQFGLSSDEAVDLRESMRVRLMQDDLGWHHLLGKERGGEQSLLEHSMAVVDVLIACLPFANEAWNPALSHAEATGVLLAAVAHDAGKAAEAFQRYLRGELPGGAEHVDSTAIQSVVERVASALGVTDEIGPYMGDLVSQAVLHDRRMRGDRGELAQWERSHESPRWRKAADLVNFADSLASTMTVIEAVRVLERHPALVGHASVCAYQVIVRGVTTTYLHEAAQEAFSSRGWRPLLFFEEGTVFAGRETVPPDRVAIRDALRVRLKRLVESRAEQLPELAVGSPLADFLPRPEYVTRTNLRALFEVASKKVGVQSELKPQVVAKYERQWRKAVARSRALCATAGQHADRTRHPNDLACLSPGPDDLDAIREVGPEACVFKLGKNIFDKVLDECDRATARGPYEERFGEGSFERLLGQSTYMPVEDYLRCVRPWHQHPGTPAGDEPAATRVGLLPQSRRVKSLIDHMVVLLERAFDAKPSPLPSAQVLDAWSDDVLSDLALCMESVGRDTVAEQLDGYATLKAKTVGRRVKQLPLQCAQCAALIRPGTDRQPSAALGNLGSFSNRRIAFESPGQPPVCGPCTTDLTIAQLALGSMPKAVVALLPRRPLGPGSANEVVRCVRVFRDELERQLSPETLDPKRYVGLSNPSHVLRAWQAGPLAQAIVPSVSLEKQKKRKQDLTKALRQRLEERDIPEMAAQYGGDFQSISGLASALVDGTTPVSLRRDGDVAWALERVSNESAVAFAAITPNLVVISMDRDLAAKSDADRAILAFAEAALFAREFGCAALMASIAEVRTAIETRAGRVAYVPANGPARRLLGGDWLAEERATRWTSAIRGALVLQDYGAGRGLLDVLRARSAGALVRRIELHAEQAPFWPKLWQHVEALKEVLGP